MLNNRKAILACLVSVLALPILAGCSGQSAPMDKDDQKNFKGGPMPESAKQIMQQKMQKPSGAPAPANGGQ